MCLFSPTFTFLACAPICSFAFTRPLDRSAALSLTCSFTTTCSLSLSSTQTQTEQMYKGQDYSGSLVHVHTQISRRQQVWLSQLRPLAATGAADEGRAACSSTTLVITSQGTERLDLHSQQQLHPTAVWVIKVYYRWCWWGLDWSHLTCK